MAAVYRGTGVGFLRNLSHINLCPRHRARAVSRAWLHNSPVLSVIEVKMPSLSPTMMEGTIVKWLKKEGDPVVAGDMLCEIQTDKAVVGFDLEEEGTLAKILVSEDVRDVKVGTLIALMAEEGEDWKSVEIPPTSDSPTDEVPQPDKIAASAEAIKHVTSGPLMYGPSVRSLLELYGLQASQIPVTGPQGKSLLKGDVLTFVQKHNLKQLPAQRVPPPAVVKTAPSPAVAPKIVPQVVEGEDFVDVELTAMRKTIAKRLTQSKTTIPHSYGIVDCQIDSVISMRKKLKNDGINVSMNDFIIKAVAVALHRCPEINVIWRGEEAVQVSEIDISVAVATDAGLITPIVKDAFGKGIEEIAITVKDLADRAKQGKLQLQEFQGGTFTISNLGMYGIKEFSAIINPPQCGILAIGTGRLMLGEDGKPCTKMTATLSYDRRVIPEDAAAKYLESVKQALENPAFALLAGLSPSVAQVSM